MRLVAHGTGFVSTGTVPNLFVPNETSSRTGLRLRKAGKVVGAVAAVNRKDHRQGIEQGSPTWYPPPTTSSNWCAPGGRVGRSRMRRTLGSRRCEGYPRRATGKLSASAVERRASRAEEALHRGLRRPGRTVAVAHSVVSKAQTDSRLDGSGPPPWATGNRWSICSRWEEVQRRPESGSR